MRLNPFSRKSHRRSYGGWLKRETKFAIAGVILFIFSLIVILGFFSASGPTGSLLLSLTRRLFGLAAYIVPFGLIWISVALIRPREEDWPRLRVIGLALTIIGLLGLLHLIGIETEDAYQAALDGRGGGLLGFTLSFPLLKLFSSATILIFLASFFIGIFLTFNLSPAEILAWLREFIPARQQLADDEEEEIAAEDEESSVPTFRLSRRLPLGGKPDPDQLKLAARQQQQEQEQKERMRQQVRAANRRYQPPALDILHSSIGKPDSGDIKANKKIIQDTLEKFGITVKMDKENVGPTVTQYTLHPPQGVKLSRITALQNDLALALAAHPIRIEAPIPRTNLVGIEIPNKEVSLVRLRDLLSSKDFRSATSPLSVVIGKSVTGRTVVSSLDTMPHLLVAGATGSGKSIFINTLILSLIYRNSPALVQMIMVDPKRVELSLFNGIPHLRTPVIVEPDKTIAALKWAVKEMDRRYRLLSESGARNLMSFNANNPDEALPMIVIIIDELADLMSTHARDVEGIIVRLSQMARAIGIHLVLATQRPSVNVITGLIKANIPTRIAFNVASQVDSRTIIDMAGAEKLLGSGDMLYLPGDQSKPVRLQAAYVSEEEVRQVVNDVVENNEPADYEDNITSPVRDAAGSGHEEINDSLYEEARQVVIESGKASATLLQTRLRVGYSRAARLLHMLEEQGVIGPAEGNKPREVLASADEYIDADGEDEDLPDDEYSGV